ncbi:MAG: M20/M25/M40 family metallo-hydrolase [Winogradskyella sp.]|uniref:M28 family metallopeptidase n=1 Tax=Winogradskyella sp. TaxID=1883156 RepID=UPI000F3ABFF6|nr:M20/M25/M40 family metallo-hydrolase [Winogradskyella sp.]RNC83452.1 MAG: M20/M25/M40 family metallo-hydrolase [Winogradskyella sp.]
MKKHSTVLIILCLVISSCGLTTKGQNGAKGKDGENSKTITITKDEVKDIVSYLASDELKGRNTGTEGIELAANFIQKQFEDNGVKPFFKGFRDEFKFKSRKDSITGFNVVGYLEGTDEKLKNEFIVIGAHYDHIGFAKKVENDTIANGANDNASGTAAVMSIAKYFSAKKNNKRSLIFALFSAEEMGLRGSAHLAEKLKSQNVDLYTMINFEMIGVPFVDRDYEAFLTGYDKSNFAGKFNEYSGSNLIGFSEVSKKYGLFKRSDNFAFYKSFGVPSHTISSCDLTNFDFYHKVGDESDEMNYEFMANLINKTIPGIEKIANTATREITLNEK